MRYTVIERGSMEDLCNDVNENLANGWALVGGVCCTVVQWTNERKGYDENNCYYAQAMLSPPTEEGAQ